MSHYGQGLKENSYNCEKFTVLNYNTNAIGGDAPPAYNITYRDIIFFRILVQHPLGIQ